MAAGMLSSRRGPLTNASLSSAESPLPINLLLRADERLRSIADTQMLQAKEISDLRQSLLAGRVRTLRCSQGGFVTTLCVER